MNTKQARKIYINPTDKSWRWFNAFFTICLVLLFSFCFVSPAEGVASGSLYLLPSSGVYNIGNNFSVVVRINTDGIAINAAEGELVFSTDKLEVVSLSKEGSVFNLWTTEPTFSNSAGTVDFGGGVPNPGYTGNAGKVFTITFKAKQAGTASVSFSSGAILANDGKGTNILSSLGSGNYTFQSVESPPPPPIPAVSQTAPTGIPAEPVVSSLTHPDPKEWYNNNSPVFKWDLPSDITGVSILLNEKPISNPGPYSDGVFDSKVYEDLDDGIWYFHIKLKNLIGWSEIAHFGVKIDTQPPRPFEIVVKEGNETDNPQPTLLFETVDELSGLAFYEVKIGEGNLFPLNVTKVRHNPYQLPLQAPGKHTIVVKAVDKGNNSTLAMAVINILPIDPPIITDYPENLLPEDILALKGTSLPKATILIYVQKKGEESIVQSVGSDMNGNWSYVFDQPVEKGIYRVWARTIDYRGAQSLPSEKITIPVKKAALVRLGELLLDHLTVIISILTFLAIIFFGSLYFWRESRHFLKKLKKETKEAEETLHRAFNALREEAEEELKLLNKVKSIRELTREEEKIRKNLRKNLTIAEKYIEKEIRDIRKNLGIKDWIRKKFR